MKENGIIMRHRNRPCIIFVQFKCSLPYFPLQSIVEKKTNIRRQRREQLQQELREQRQAQQTSASPPKQPKEQQQQPRESEPLKQVENCPPNNATNAPTSPPAKSPPSKPDPGKTIAFGRTISKAATPPKPASRLGHVRRYSLENDNVSIFKVRTIFCPSSILNPLNIYISFY